jgi:hypothetical protein
MMKPKVYIETTIPSFYHEVRTEPDMVARRQWTRQWNCQNLANANKFGHIRRVNAMLGLYVPLLVTPLELLGGLDEIER